MRTITKHSFQVPWRLFLVLSVLALEICRTSVAQPLRAWTDYRTIMWVGDSAYKHPEKLPLFFQRLREMGINTAMVYGDGDPQPLVQAKMPYYVENVVNRGLCLKFNSNVTDWDKFVTDWAKNGRPESALIRAHCLDDPEWVSWATKQMQLTAHKNREHEPFAYNIRDELSTTVSANPFDYDFNPVTLNQFREWLKNQYTNLATLNAEWETSFSSWADVKPFTTDQIKNRMAGGDALPRGNPDWQALQRLKFVPAFARQSPTRWNFAPWADFRSYMDLSLARVLDQISHAAHEIDPRTPVGIEGTQMPHAFGGYNLWRISQVLDWIEPYDIGCAREILGSFMPAKPILTTVFEQDTNHARRRLWHLLLEGDRGCIVWWSEDCIDWDTEDYLLSAKARALAPVLKEMTSPLARLFLRAEPERDPIFIHYSQPSIQVDWLIESTVDGSTWLRRFSSFEAEHNRQAKIRNAWLKAFQDLGFNPQFISCEQIARSALRQIARGVLILPTSWALSTQETSEIDRWIHSDASQKRLLFFDSSPALFDEHGRLRTQGPPAPFAELKPDAKATCISSADDRPAATCDSDVAAYLVERLKDDATPRLTAWIHDHSASFRPEVSLPANTRVKIYRFHIDDVQLLAFERNIDYQMSEDLKQAGGNETLEKAIELRASLKTSQHIYDLMHHKYLGYAQQIPFTLDPWQPALFAMAKDRKMVESLVSRERE
ncbi:MAG TPA: beta-galactosidase [Candidatus Limnocylindrales bacterium]|nr:beta-galactosidase [Candidatus Limnocylindrales bacterium]